MRKAVFAAFLALTAANGQAGDLWPWASQTPKEPPKVQPFEIPTFDGGRRDFRAPASAWTKAPRIDGDAVFRMIVACYPSRSQWNIDVDLQAALRNTSAVDVTGTQIGRSMIGIVARMPLYSATEVDREREREYRRRQDTAQTVADLATQLAARNQAVRVLALSGSMEQRAQVRVNQGIADADEQIKWLDRVAGAEKDLITAESKAAEARLKLVSQCRDEASDTVNAYLTELSQLPTTAKP